MSQTSIRRDSPLAIKAFSALMLARIIQVPGWFKNMTGASPTPKGAEGNLKGQTSPDMPIVRVTDLSRAAGQNVSVDCFDTINGKPIMGDQNAEGKGESISSSSMEAGIDLTTKVIDAGGKMSAQRTIHDLRKIAMSHLTGYFGRLNPQRALVHLAGARGSMQGMDWIIPVASDADFDSIMINPVKAPTYNRHMVINGTALVKGGQQLNLIDSADVWTLDNINELSLLLDDMEFPMQPVKIKDDPAADDDPIKAILCLTPRQWNQIYTNAGGSSNDWRTFMQNAWNRKSYGSKHPLFSGEPGMWNKILVKVMPKSTIRFLANETTKIITSANRLSATESDVVVNPALPATHGVERALLLGGQALAHVLGRNNSTGSHFSWYEKRYNFDRASELAGDCMDGMAKMRFQFKNSQGLKEPTDLGVMVIDSAVKL